VQTSEKVSLTYRADATDGSYLRNAGIRGLANVADTGHRSGIALEAIAHVGKPVLAAHELEIPVLEPIA
jgi:hypothetical protein